MASVENIREQIQDGDAAAINILKSVRRELTSRPTTLIMINTIKEQIHSQIDELLDDFLNPERK